MKTARILAAAAVLAVCAQAAQAQVILDEPSGEVNIGLSAIGFSEFVTSNGRRVSMPPIDGMSCQQMENKLAEIDATVYRVGPTPKNPTKDAPLFEYERDLAETHYNKCVLERASGLNRESFQMFRPTEG